MRLDQGKINTIIKAWQDHPFAKTAVIKAQVARYLPAGTVVGTGPITKYYPWERKVGETIRQNQARRALETYPSMKKCELIQLTGISNNTFDRTVGVVYPSDRRRASVQTPLAQSESIQADIEQRVLESSKAAMDDVWKRLYDKVEWLAGRLANPENTFNNATYEDAKDLVKMLSRLNFTDDPDLEQMRRDVERKLVSHHPESLRNDPVLRNDTANEAKAIMDKMAVFMGGA